ncbi:MAG: hypothetical protein M1838_000060 [Thelocarpon superellum]|nr:MAG: hypothetical protein M1838_000060 [Thelocarpon superellum]
MPIIGTTAVVLRFWSQRLIKARLHWDDYTMLASLVLMFGLWTIFILMYWYFRVGKHEITVSPSMGESGLLMLYIGQVLYCFTYSLIKISILLLYHRLFVLPWFRLCTKICLGFVICFIVGGTAASIFTCNPIDGFWKMYVPATCIDALAVYYATSSINLVTDLIILVLPMPVIWSLKVPRRQKYVLCAIFVLGSGVLIATIFRIVALREVDDSDLTCADIEPPHDLDDDRSHIRHRLCLSPHDATHLTGIKENDLLAGDIVLARALVGHVALTTVLHQRGPVGQLQQAHIQSERSVASTT